MDLAQIVQQERQRHQNERQYVREFNVVTWKMARKMSDLTSEEAQLWRKWLCHYWHHDIRSTQCDDIKDFFDVEDIGEDMYNDEIQVRIWQWTHAEGTKEDYLIDLNAWPGDNESGGIFLQGELVFANSDQDLAELESTPGELRLREDALQHLRTFQCTQEEDYDEDPIPHQHCERVAKRLKDLKGEKGYTKLSYMSLEYLINDGQIQSWKVSSFPARPGHVKMLFGYNQEQGYEYLTEVQYDPSTGTIYPPL